MLSPCSTKVRRLLVAQSATLVKRCHPAPLFFRESCRSNNDASVSQPSSGAHLHPTIRGYWCSLRSAGPKQPHGVTRKSHADFQLVIVERQLQRSFLLRESSLESQRYLWSNNLLMGVLASPRRYTESLPTWISFQCSLRSQVSSRTGNVASPEESKVLLIACFPK